MTASGSPYTPHPVDNLSPLSENILDLLKIFSHDCRNDLLSMGAALALLEKGFYGRLDEQASREIHRVFQRASKAIGLLEDTVAQALVLKSELGLRMDAISLVKDILEPLFQELSHDIPRERFSVIKCPFESICDRDLQVQGNKFLLRSVFRNLMRNAAAYGAEHEKIIIRINRMDRYVIVDVCNQDRLSSREPDENAFTKWKVPTSGPGREKQGLGIGLSLVQKIVESHGGRMWRKAERNASHFLFSLLAPEELH